ncbi:murein biosynthesis integral membrane protein MurJ [Sphingomonas swuensis]|uniref:Probable lipid II flippase MurJ n=1 Tax=Sphingomonas swuensis TaxID=977800 RepID=A0ABP7T2D3_9SPHN
MNLLKATGTIGGLTMVSRILGFAREMLMARIMGATAATDAFLLAFRLPNTFRRLFGEGAFSAGFVPLYAQRLQGEDGEAEARKFSEEVLAVFLPTLVLFTLFFQLIMPAFVAVWSGYKGEQFDLTVLLTRITFPYLILISLVSLWAGILNSLSRFTAAAFAPALLNLCMMVALIIFPQGGAFTAFWLAVAVTIGGVIQLGLLIFAAVRAGVSLRLRRPRITPGVRQFLVVVIPATLGAGVYQISAFIDTFFLARAGVGAQSWFNYADRFNQLPLGVIGAALGTAILPQISRFVGANEPDKAAHVQAQALDLGMFLTLPAALALCVVSGPLISALYGGGEFTARDASVTATVLSILVLGLPAYVLVKVLTPGFYSRQDTATPVKTAGVVLLANVVLNFAIWGATSDPLLRVYGLSAVVAITSWLNCLILYVVLHRRGHFRVPGWLASRVFRQLVAGAVMVAALLGLEWLLADWFTGSLTKQLLSVAALVGGGMAIYFPLCWAIGGVDRQAFRELLARKRPAANA